MNVPQPSLAMRSNGGRNQDLSLIHISSYSWADRELKAFRRVTLEPGETATVVFDIPVCDCTIADADANRIV